MPVCPRCKYPTDQASTICTQCGATIRAEPEQRSSFSPAKILLVLVLVALFVILLILAMEYSHQADVPGR